MAGQKKACPNCDRKFKTNELLVRHMEKTPACSKFIITCRGCNKKCANQDHLENHIRQRQKEGFRCYDVFDV